MNMDALNAARVLGVALQNDQRYIDYAAAKKANDADEELQKLIEIFNGKRREMQLEMNKPQEEQDEKTLQRLNQEMRDSYGELMKNANMANFAIVKNALDQLLNEINMIISMACEGEDPMTCDPHAAHGCSGSCSTCGGCG